LDSNQHNYNNVPVKGLFLDYSSINESKEIWTYARNVVINSQLGQIVQIQNEPANEFCCTFPYSFNGSIKLKNSKHIIFTTDNTNSEIGIFNEKDCSYSTIINDDCLNFKLTNPIFGSSKENFDGSETIYWADGQLNEVRYLNLSKIPYKSIQNNDDCKSLTYTKQLDCDALSFTRKMKIPCIDKQSGDFGALKNGTYQLAIAYSQNFQRLTDYFSITNPVNIFNKSNSGGSIEVDISNLDKNFDKYQLLLISTIENQTFYNIIGEFDISQTKHSISSIRSEYTPVPLEELTVKRAYYQKADYLVSNDQHLFLAGVSKRKELNYQKQALNIKAKYQVVRVPLDFYKKNNDVGYYRDEVYSFSIEWVYDDGETSKLFHIKGRDAKKYDLEKVYGNDVFDHTVNCTSEKPTFRYQVYNTASSYTLVIPKTNCNATLIGEGEMAYVQSSDLYPDNADMFGEYACNPIQHHKFPDESKVPRYETIGTKTYINILGVKFENIHRPVDSDNVPIPGIIGYKIWRGDRNGNKSVISRGLFSNVRSYKNQLKKTVKYSNYPYNFMGEDKFLSQTQTIYKSNTQKNFTPLKDVSTDEFIYFSPHNYFDRIGLGDYMVFESEESGTIKGYFEEVFNHPKAKLLSDNVLLYAIIIGALDGYLRAFRGKKTSTKLDPKLMKIILSIATAGTSIGVPVEKLIDLGVITSSNDAKESMGSIDAGANIGDKIFLTIIKTLLSSGAFVFYAAETAQKVIDSVYNFTAWKQYSIQYNSSCTFNKSTPIKPENKVRKIESYQYLSSGLNTLQSDSSVEFNNNYRENNIYLKINKSVSPLKGDTSQVVLGNLSLKSSVESTAKLYYGTVKRTIYNQYGQINSIIYQETGTCIQKINKSSNVFTSDIIFGGDCFINVFSVNHKTDLFSQPLFNIPDGIDFDYRSVPAMAFPKYWADYSKYQLLDIIPKKSNLSSLQNLKESNLPQQKYNLNGKKTKGFSVISNAYLYNSINGVFEFIVESDYNLDLRDYKGIKADFFTKNKDLSELFKNNGIDRHYEEFIYDKSFSKQIKESINYQQEIDFNPLIDLSYDQNRVIYSLPCFKEQKFDNWLNFLPNNLWNFPQGQFGKVTSIKLLDNQKLIFLFDKSSPYITPGISELKTVSNETVYLGDGSILREPRPLLVTDDFYGNSQSRFAFNHTKFGCFYPSMRKGNLFQYSDNLDEISRNGVFYFFDKYLPLQIVKDFSNIPTDTPYNGVGLLSTYDPSFETYYLTKKDYSVHPDYKNQITYDEKTDTFKFKNTTVSLTDGKYFIDCSWTISYNPSLKAFISFHDYHPNAYISSENHFYTVKNDDGKSSIYLHNNRCDLFSNFYGKDYPHAFTLPINSGAQVDIFNSVEFQAQAFTYQNNCSDAYHNMYETYNRALIYNSEQISGWLNLLQKNKNSAYEAIQYNRSPFNSVTQGFDIYIDKREQKFRFNKFKDITKDRLTLQQSLIQTHLNGYTFNLNPEVVDYTKHLSLCGKIRHTQSKLYLEKTVSGSTKHIFYLTNINQTKSPI
jgi:hypothetical protein